MNKFYKSKNNLFNSRNKNIEILKSYTERESTYYNEKNNLTKQNNNNHFNTITNFYNNKISSNKNLKKHNNLEAIDINIYQTDKKNIFIYNMMKNFNQLDEFNTIDITNKNENHNKLNKDNFNLSKIINKIENYKNNKINKINKFNLNSFKFKKKISNKIKKPKKFILSSKNLLQLNYNTIDNPTSSKKVKNKINSLDLQYKKINVNNIHKESIKIFSKEKNKNKDFINNLYNNYFIQKNKNKRLIDKINNISQDKISKIKTKKKEENKILKKTKSSINLKTNFSLINTIKNINHKFNKFQTSSNFYKFKINFNQFKTKENKKKYTFDINNIIYNVIENNKKAAAFKSSNYFNKIGTDYINFHMKTINYNSSNSHKKYNNYNINLNNNNNYENNKRTSLNSIKISLTNPLEWKKHEEIWKNILKLPFISMEIEKYLIPPNENEVLISTYLKLNSKILNFVSYEKNNNNYYLYFYIDDNIENPKLEMKKWKDAYKEVLLRWHPDKLSAILKEILLKKDEIKKILKKKSTMIINNMNNKFKNIIEILRKIYNYQNMKNNNNDNYN